MKPSGVLNFENVPTDAGDPDVKVYVNGDLVETGGGGSSDFALATLTIGNNIQCDVFGAVFDLSQMFELPADTLPTVISQMSEPSEGSYTVCLYKGCTVLNCFNDNMDHVEISGNIEPIDPPVEGSYLYVITGDCSITYED